MKKFLCILFSAAMLLSLLSACGGAATEEQTAEVEQQQQEEEVAEALDFQGYNFIFRSAYMGAYLTLDPTKATIVSDYEQQQFDNAAKKFNCTIEPIEYSNQSVLATYLTNCAATGTDFETHFNYDIQMETLYNLGVVIDLYSLDNVGIDFTDTAKWGSVDSRLGRTAPDGAYYAIVASYWPTFYNSDGVILVNDELVAAQALVSPQEYLEKGEWTFEGFKNLIPTYGVVENEETSVYSLMLYHCNDPVLAYGALIANGVEFVSKVDGKDTFNLGCSEAVTALQWAQDIIAMDDYVYEAPSHTDRTFSDGKAVMYWTNGWRGLSNSSDFEVQNNLKDFSWMCLPYGPSVEYGKTVTSYSNLSTNGTGVGIIDTEMALETAYILNEIFEPITAFGEDGYWSYLKEYFFHDEDSYIRYRDMYNNRTSNDIRPLSGGLGTLNETLYNIIRGTSVVQGIASVSEAMQAYIDASPYKTLD